MYWAFAFVAIMLVSGALTTLYFAYLGWRLRRSTGAIAFIVLMLSISFWSLSYTLEQFTPVLDEKIFWHKMAYIGIPFVPVAWFTFNAQVLGLRFASRTLWICLLAIIPVSTTILTWTYEWHSWMWDGFMIEYHQGIPYLAIERASEYFYYAGYSYILLFAGIILFVRILLQSPSIGGPSIAVMAFAVIGSVVFNILRVAFNTPIFGPYDLSPITLASIGVIAGWFVFRFGPLDVLSVARVALLENIDDGFIVLGLSQRVVSMNSAAQRMLGISEKHASGRELKNIFPAEASCFDRGARPTFIAEIMGLGINSLSNPDTKQEHHELVLPNPDNKETDLYVDLSISNLFDRRNRPRGSLIILRDVTQRKQDQQALIQAQRVESAGVLAGGVAHDFNNLLAAISMRHQLAIDSLGGSPPQNSSVFDIPTLQTKRDVSADSLQNALRHLYISQKAADRAADLTRQLLAYTGKGDFKIEPIELNDLIRENSELLATAVPKEINLDISLASKTLFILADQGQLQQVIMNLILNGVEAIGSNSGQIDVQLGLIDIGISEAQGYIWKGEPIAGNYANLRVSDSGSGMSPELQARIFDPFFTTKKDGRGLGLSALLGAIHLYGGGIQVFSKKDKGTTFSVLLPTASEAEAVPRVIAPGPTLLEHSDLPRTILIVDDEEPIRDVLEEILAEMGLDVITASDGRQAIETFKDHQSEIDVVLLDAKMPVLGGIETLAILREIDPTVCALLSSGYSEQHLSGSVIWDKQTDFIQKPYEVDTLIEKIDRLLSKVDSANTSPPE